jgi:Ca2+/H+ antiporter
VLGLFAIFGGVSSFVEVRGYIDALIMVASIMAGSLGWWVGLSKFIGSIRHKLNPGSLTYINKIAGAVLLIFGGVLIGEIILKYANFI